PPPPPPHPDHQPRLADAGFTSEQHRLSFARLCLAPAVNQQRQLMLAADQRDDGCTTQRLKPALGTAFSGHSPSVDLLGETFGPVRTEFLEPEQPTDEPSSRLADHQ